MVKIFKLGKRRSILQGLIKGPFGPKSGMLITTPQKYSVFGKKLKGEVIIFLLNDPLLPPIDTVRVQSILALRTFLVTAVLVLKVKQVLILTVLNAKSQIW